MDDQKKYAILFGATILAGADIAPTALAVAVRLVPSAYPSRKTFRVNALG